MELVGGMVAVVRGLGDDGLAVTLLDAGKQYTLVPNKECKNVVAKNYNSQQSCYTAVDAGTQSSEQCDSSIQVTDDAYVSTYKNAHCNIRYTSPNVLVSEFPRQRAQWHRGQSNFEVGGVSSGGIPLVGFKEETNRIERVPKLSREFDAFAKTLRKYPVPAAKSSEMVQRLISYTSKRNCKFRSDVHSSMAKEILLETSRTPKPSDADSTDKKIEDEPPTRDDEHEQAKKLFRKESCKNFDVMKSKNEINNNNSVNIEVQESAVMVSKGVMTHQRIRNVAVSLTPMSSSTRHNCIQTLNHEATFKSIQTTLSEIKMRKSVQTLSSIDVRKKRCKNIRRTRSQEEFRVKKSDILEWFEDILKDHFRFTAKGSRKKKNCSLKQDDCGNIRIRFGECLTNVPMEDCKTDSDEYLLCEESCQDADNNKNVFRSVAQVFTANVANNPNLKLDSTKLKYVAYNWFQDIPMKSYDFLNRDVNKDEIFNVLFQKIIATYERTLGFKATRRFKEQIVNFLDEIPLIINGRSNKSVYLNQLADLLIENLESNGLSNKLVNTNQSIKFNLPGCLYRRPVMLSEQELRAFVTDEIEDLFNKFDLLVKVNLLESIVTRIVFTLSRRAENCIFLCDDRKVQEEIVAIFNEVGILSPEQATVFANSLKDNFIQLLKRVQREKVNVLNVFQNSCEISNPRTPKSKIVTVESNSSEMDYLVLKINEWLRNLQLNVDHDNRFRIVKKLAEDILDRCKYLVLNPSSRGSGEEELNYLKYQIFKRVGKVVGEDNTEIIEAAPDLMARIKTIIDMYNTNHEETRQYGQQANRTRRIPNFSDNLKKVILTDVFNPVIESQKFNEIMNFKQKTERSPANFLKIPFEIHPSLNKSQPIGANNDCLGRGACCSKDPTIGDETAAYVEQINMEHANFLDQWVQEIPLPEETETKENIDKARQGILAAVWKAIAKVKCNPEVYNNSYLFEDLFDDELEKVFDMIPDSAQLDAVKTVLKSKLIAKTSDTLRNLRERHPNYRNQVIANVTRRKNILTRDKVVSDEVELYEEFKIKKLVDDFILSVRYTDDDKVKANIYRKKLIKGVEQFVAQLKEIYGGQLHEMNEELYRNDILNAMIRVPQPNEDTIRQEVDKILLEIEIEKWFDDLPLIENSDQIEQQMRKRKRDMLAMKIYEMEKELNIQESCGERALKHEISNFLDKMPMKKEEKLNINFMIEELVNRVKNRQKEPTFENGRERRNSVEFQEPLNYDEFGKNIPCHSTFAEAIVENQSENGQTSQFPNVGGYDSFADYKPVSSSLRQDIDQPAYRTASFVPSVSEPIEEEQKWYTLHESADIKDTRSCVKPDGTSCCKRTDATEVDRRARQSSPVPKEPKRMEQKMPDIAEVRSGTGQNKKNYRDSNVAMKTNAQDMGPKQCLKQKEYIQYQRDKMKRISGNNIPDSTNIETQAGRGVLGTSQMPGPSCKSRPWVSQQNESAQISRDNGANWPNQSIATPNTISLLKLVENDHANQYGPTPEQNIPNRIPTRPGKEAAPRNIPKDMPRQRLNFDNLGEQLPGTEEEDFRCRCLERYRAWRKICETRQDDNNLFPPPYIGWSPYALWPPYSCFFP